MRTGRQVLIGDVISDHLPYPALWRRRFDCSCGWRGGRGRSWIGHLAGEIDAALP